MSEDKPSTESQPAETATSVQSLRELIDLVTGRKFHAQFEQEDAGLAEVLPYPFLGLVGQLEVKLALLIAVINPLVSGVLLLGPRGTGKTTIVRSLFNLMPTITRSACYYGCLPEDIEIGGMDAVCPDCARKYGEGQPLIRVERGRLVELPLNARLDDVIGGWDERSVLLNRPSLKSGLLKQADQNILYIDEVNLLPDDIINAILDASAQGTYTVRRGPLSSTYRARITLIGSMNPEEGNLRPQIMDRFGLRVVMRGLATDTERIEAYRRTRAYRSNPRAAVSQYAFDTEQASVEIQAARDLLPGVDVPRAVELAGTRLIQQLGIDSLRAEITLFEAARAYAAADGRKRVQMSDLKVVAPMALRLRQSPFMIQYFQQQQQDEATLNQMLDGIIPNAEESKNGEEIKPDKSKP